MPRFVILEHNYPAKHWDFLLEEGDHLRAWKLLEDPQAFLRSANQQGKISLKAKAKENYRLIYLDYEGPISDNRGEVKRFDFGTFTYVEQNDQALKIDLQGRQLKGVFKLSLLVQDNQISSNKQIIDDKPLAVDKQIIADEQLIAEKPNTSWLLEKAW